jgi:hypothetical protein
LGWSLLLDPPTTGASLGDGAKSMAKPHAHDLLVVLSQRFDFANQPTAKHSEPLVQTIIQQAKSSPAIAATDNVLKNYSLISHQVGQKLKVNHLTLSPNRSQIDLLS